MPSQGPSGDSKNYQHTKKNFLELSKFQNYWQSNDLNYLSNLKPSTKSLILRGIFSILMICYFFYTIYSGPLLIICTMLVIQVKCYLEIINIGYNVCKMQNVKWFRCLSWYFLIIINYYCYCQAFLEYFGVFIDDNSYLQLITRHYKFKSLLFYVIGIIFFILNLGKSYDKNQFSILAWTHVTLLIIVTQSYIVINNMFQGLIWLILPISVVSINDIMAFFFGKNFGKTPLIKLSPKKTWEGFIGGGISTIIFGLILSYVLCQYDYLVCPIEYKRLSNGNIVMITTCERSYLFRPYNYTFAYDFFDLFVIDGGANIYPFLLHAFWLLLFTSVIAPFGGFFSSGFKRAFDVKDFSNAIPGHGGLMDRFDCQYLMGTFVNVYISSFIKNLSLDKLYGRILNMNDNDQVILFKLLEENLKKQINITF